MASAQDISIYAFEPAATVETSRPRLLRPDDTAATTVRSPTLARASSPHLAG